LPSVKEKHSPKAFLPSVKKTRGKEFSNLRNLNIVFASQDDLKKKLSTTVFYNFLRSTKFI